MGLSVAVNEGDPIILNVALYDYASDKYVRAILRADGTLMPQSPRDLISQGDGSYIYFDTLNLTYPSGAKQVTALFEVYEDAGYTIKSDEYQADLDVWYQAAGTQDIIDNINDIKNLVAGAQSLVGIINEDIDLEGIVIEEIVTGLVLGDDYLLGTVIEGDELFSDLDDFDLSGSVS